MSEKLKIPKYLEERFGILEKDYDLIDDCQYMLYFNKGWACGDLTSIPVKSKKEALDFLRTANRYEGE